MMKIYFLSPDATLNPNNKKKLESIGNVIYLQVNRINGSEIVNKARDAEVLLISPKAVQKLTSYFFESMPKLKHLALLSSGYEWIDVKGAIKNGVSVSCCIGANAESVAEHTWGLILNLSKRITEHDRDLHFSKNFISKKYNGVELEGKTLGILGTGNIGKLVAKIGKCLNMRVFGYNRQGIVHDNFDQITNLAFLLKESDVVSVNLPLNKETENLIGSREIKHVKTGVIIVNTAREKIINKTAILRALKEEKIFGYGVDVEKLSINDPYLQFPNVIVNIHNAFNTREAKQRMENLAINNIEAFAFGKPINIITL